MKLLLCKIILVSQASWASSSHRTRTCDFFYYIQFILIHFNIVCFSISRGMNTIQLAREKQSEQESGRVGAVCCQLSEKVDESSLELNIFISKKGLCSIKTCCESSNKKRSCQISNTNVQFWYLLCFRAKTTALSEKITTTSLLDSFSWCGCAQFIYRPIFKNLNYSKLRTGSSVGKSYF